MKPSAVRHLSPNPCRYQPAGICTWASGIDRFGRLAVVSSTSVRHFGLLFLLLARHRHHLAPTFGLGCEHRAELVGVAGDRNRAEFIEPRLDGGIGERRID